MCRALSPFEKEWRKFQKKRDKIRQIVAAHEAAHCVLATYFGYTVFEVSIVPEKDSMGHCKRETMDFKKLSEAEACSSRINEIIILVGGHVGESLVTRRGLPSIDRLALSGARTDHERAWKLIQEILGRLDEDATSRERLLYLRACRAFLNYQIAYTHRMIHSEPFRTVTMALANEILGWEKLSGDQAREIMLNAFNLLELNRQEESSPADLQTRAG